MISDDFWCTFIVDNSSVLQYSADHYGDEYDRGEGRDHGKIEWYFSTIKQLIYVIKKKELK